jgi:hypothetical protein
MKKVNSSHLNFVHYDPSTKTCMVQFKNGDTYHYQGMSQEAYNAFLNAKSPGQHLRNNIIGKYTQRKV